MQHHGPDWFSYVAMGLVLVMSGYMFWSIEKLFRLEKLDDEERKAKWPRARDRMFVGTGLWQWTVGIVLISLGSWVNTIALFGMGAMMMFGVWFNRKLNQKFDASA